MTSATKSEMDLDGDRRQETSEEITARTQAGDNERQK